MRRVLQRLLDASTRVQGRVVITTGPVLDPHDLRIPRGSSVEVHRSVPHGDLMPDVSLVVSHGGHGTAMRALAHDLPLLVVPLHPLLDHRPVGAAVERAGAGHMLSPFSPLTTVDRLGTVMEVLAHEGSHRVAAARLGAAIREAPGPSGAAVLLEQVLDGVLTVPRPGERPDRPGR